MEKNFACVVCLFCAIAVMAQPPVKKITGLVTDSSGVALPGISVSLIDQDNAGRLFAITRTDGRFAFNNVPDSLWQQPLFLKISAIGYRIEKIPVSLQQDEFSVTLFRKTISLPPVTVQSDQKGVRIGADTTGFKVSQFQESDDRVIADVIARLPGLSVSDNGQISFNGKPVTNVYIDGENILDGRYKIATQNVPAAMVDEVQVIERDQPIRALNGYVASAKTSLNLKLASKANVTVTTGEIAAGNKGGELNAFNITLDKRIKALTELKANNIGVNNSGDADFSVANDNNAAGWDTFQHYLSDRIAQMPAIGESYYLRNKDIGAKTHLFRKISNDLSIRFMMSGQVNRRHFMHQYLRQYFVQADTISFSEVQDNRQTEKEWKPRFDIEWNNRKHYLKSVTEGVLPESSDKGVLVNNGNPFDQRLARKGHSIGNETTLIRALGQNKVIQYHSLLQQHRTGERLDITPGIELSMINNGNPYSSLNQLARNRSSLVEQQVSLRGRMKNVAWMTGAGVAYKQESLASQLYYREKDEPLQPVDGNYANDAVFRNFNVYGTAELIFSVKKDYLTFGLLSGYYVNRISDRLTDRLTKKNIAGHNPYLQFRKQLGLYGELMANFRSGLEPGTLADIYTGNLLINYREIVAHAVPLPVTRKTQGSLSFYYKKPLRMLFYNFSLSWSKTAYNYMTSYEIDEMIATLVSLDRRNNQYAYSAAGSLSKYLFDWKTNLRVSGSAQLLEGQNLLNDELIPYRLLKYNAGLSWNVKLSSSFSFTGSVDEGYQALRNKVQHSAARKSYLNSEQIALQLNYAPVERLVFTPSFNVYTFRRSFGNLSTSFLDLSVLYRPARIRGEFRLSGRNIGGKSLYRDGTVMVNSISSFAVPLVKNRFWLKYLFSF